MQRSLSPKNKNSNNDEEHINNNHSEKFFRTRSSSTLLYELQKKAHTPLITSGGYLGDISRRSSTTSTDSTTSSTHEQTKKLRFLDQLSFSGPHSPRNMQQGVPFDINAWMIPYKEESSRAISVEEYLAKLPSGYLPHSSRLSKGLDIIIGMRAAKKTQIPIQRRISLADPDADPNTPSILATPKSPPYETATNLLGPTRGHIPRRSKLQEKPACPLDNNIRGAFPEKLDLMRAFDASLTDLYKKNVTNNIISVYKYHNLICWEEKVPEYIQEQEVFNPTGRLVPKCMIQEAVHIYWILDKIKQCQNNSNTDDDRYEFVSATANTLTFTYNGELNKIFLNVVMPAIRNSIEQIILEMEEQGQVFLNLEDFAHHVENLDLLSHHAAIFYYNGNNCFVPEMVWSGNHGGITSDLDVQFFSKRFDMPRVAYAIFEAKKAEDHIKFKNGLLLLKQRLLCASKQEFDEFINNCDFKETIEEYLSKEELEADEYLNYADPNDAERYKYYIETYMPLLNATISHYNAHPEGLKIVCTSDINSLVLQFVFKDPYSIHAGEDTNLHPAKEFGAILITDHDNFMVAENEATLLATLFSEPDLLKQQVVGMNPYYLRDRNLDAHLSQQWLDVIVVRCLHAAAISDFEFKMHWKTIERTFAHDKLHGPIANEKVAFELSKIQTLLQTLNSLPEAERTVKRNEFINAKLGSIYSSYSELVRALKMSIEENAKQSATLDLEEDLMDFQTEHVVKAAAKLDFS